MQFDRRPGCAKIWLFRQRFRASSARMREKWLAREKRTAQETECENNMRYARCLGELSFWILNPEPRTLNPEP